VQRTADAAAAARDQDLVSRSLTLDTYSHAIPTTPEEEAVKIAEVVFAAK
jgi:hypothetical protein